MSGHGVVPDPVRVSTARQRLEALFEDRRKELAHEGDWPGAVVRVSLRGSDFTWASGVARRDHATAMRTDTGFHIASVGKAMTAVLILQLMEKGCLGPKGLDARIQDFSSVTDVVQHIGAFTNQPVTLRQMLNHSSGLKDAFSDDGTVTSVANAGKPAPNSLSASLRSTPSRDMRAGRGWPAWTPERIGDPTAGVLNWFIWGSGAADSLAHTPGTAFHYSDTAYMLLGILAERLAGQTYEALLASRVFEPLGLRSTYLAYGEAAPDAWRGEVSDFALGGHAVFSDGIDVSWDWGGGGQISTAGDLENFLRGLFSGRLFAKPETLTDLLAFQGLPGMPKGCTGLGAGVRRLTSPSGVELWGHAGAWGVQAFYAPAFDATITGTFNQPMAASEFMRQWIFEVADSLRTLADDAGQLSS